MSTPAARRYRVFWPLLLVSVGAGLLVAQTGSVSAAALGRLAATWPVFLILGGISLALRRYLSPGHAALVLVAAFVALGGGATLYAVAGQEMGGTRTVEASMPRGEVNAASLIVNASAVTLHVTVGDTGGNLFVARVTGGSGARPAVHVDAVTGVVTIDADNRDWWPFSTRSATVTVTLSQDVGWSVNVNAASVDGTMNLDGAARTIEVNAAADNLGLELASPSAAVPVQLNGAAIATHISVVEGVPIRVSASGLGVSIAVDGRSWSGIGEQTWSDPDYSGAVNSYDISANGASVQVRVTHVTVNPT